MSSSSLVRSFVLALAAGALVVSSANAQAQSGTITGRVTDAANGTPVAPAQVIVVGTNIRVETNSQGQYTLRGVPSGQVQLRALRVGFSDTRQSATVVAGQTATVDIPMHKVTVTLNPIVTTATGDQRRLEVGNAIAQIDASKIVETKAVQNMGDLLTARAPGIAVFTGTQIGAGTRIRIRGTSSLNLSNNPLFIVDGIRVEGATGSSSISVGGTTAARLNDLNPEEIQSIDVVRGPSAASLYGTSAANGVIVITTKRGVAGRPRWNYFTEQGAHVDRNDYPDAYRGWTKGSTPSNSTQCFLAARSAGTCTQDSVTSYNLYKDPETTPNGTGYRQLHGLQVGGGSELLRYFLHGEWENDNGILKVPEFDQRYLTAHGRTLLPEEANPSHLDRITSRANFNLALSPKADLALSSGYISQDLRLPTSDDSGTNGLAGNTYGGPGFKYNLTSTGDTLFGYRQFTPRDVYQTVTTQGIKRAITSLDANYRPFGWLVARGNFGLDYINRLETQLCRFGNCPDFGADSKLGFKTDNRTNFFSYTATSSATGSRQLRPGVGSKTTLGLQYARTIFDRNGANGVRLPPGATTLTAAAVPTIEESSDETRTLGSFIEEALAFRDKLFVTGAMRSDHNSAAGANFRTVFYPKMSVSWIASDGRYSWLNQLRFRAAYGQSGVQPGTTDAVPYYSGTTIRGESGESPALVFSTLGNRNLKPERSSEIEVGVDGTLWNNRLSTEITYYRKSSKDALILRPLPPSLGTGATGRFENLGRIRNSGWEVLVNAQLVQREAFGWDVTINSASNENRIISLGGLPSFGGSTQQQREGYPLNGWWAKTLLDYKDANGDGLITLNEITVSDTARFIGSPLPKRDVAFTNNFTFFNRRLSIGSMIDYKGGFKMYNNTQRIRCSSRNNCSGLINPNASLFEQARTVMVREHLSKSVAGFIEKGDFVRFRELNLTFSAPDAFANRFRARNLMATFAARNLGVLSTKYTGVDPEAFGTTGNAPSEFQAFPPPTYYVLRLSLGF